jgi:hypothetical protein
MSKKHPYLFLDQKDVPLLRQRIAKEPFRQRWALLKANADHIVTATTPANPAGAALDSDGKANDFFLARWHLGNAGTCAFAYVVSGQREYAARAIREALHVAGQSADFWAGPKDWNKGAALETAANAMTCALVYDWCHDVLSPPERETLKQALLVKGIEPYLLSVDADRSGGGNPVSPDQQDWWVTNPVSNWAGVVHGGMGTAALALYFDDGRARRAVEAAKQYLPGFLDHVFGPDGGAHEGIMYALYGQEWALYFIMAAGKLWGFDQALLRRLTEKLAGYWDIYLQGPDGRYANFNNMEELVLHDLWSAYYARNDLNAGLRQELEGMRDSAPSGPNSVMSALFESLVPGGDPLLLWAADNGGSRYKWRGTTPFYFLWRREDAPSLLFQESPPLQKAVLFRETGHAILRSPDLWLAYNGGWISDCSHSNCDLGSFVLVAGQERLVHDPGYGDGETGQHSTVLVGGRGQRRGGRGEFLRFGSGRRFHYLASDLSKVYEDPSLQRFVRHMVMVDGSYLVILDDLQADSPADFEWRLQTRHTVTVNADRAVVQGQQWDLQVHNALAGQTMETVVWRRQHKEESLTCLSIRVGAASAMAFLTVLFPIRKEQGAAMPEVRCQTPGVVEVTRGELISDRIVFEKRKDHWTLTSVNDEDAEDIPNGKARTLKAFRADADSQNSGVRSQESK